MEEQINHNILISDGNSIYEIDAECLKAKQNGKKEQLSDCYKEVTKKGISGKISKNDGVSHFDR
jgi:hypothetical protein